MRTWLSVGACLAALALSIVSLAFARQSTSGESQAEQSVLRLAATYKNWGTGKLNSPGASVTLKEVSRQETQAGTAVDYRILTHGFPSGQVYTLTIVPFNLRPHDEMSGITLDSSGQAICAGTPGTCTGDKANDPIDLIILAAKGEPKLFGLVSEDGKVKAFVSVVPFPIMGKNNGCTVEATLLEPEAQAVLIHGTGFEPNAKVSFTSSSEGETHPSGLEADHAGSVFEVMLPYVKGKTKGVTHVRLTSGSCSPSLSFQWGKGTYKFQ